MRIFFSRKRFSSVVFGMGVIVMFFSCLLVWQRMNRVKAVSYNHNDNIMIYDMTSEDSSNNQDKAKVQCVHPVLPVNDPVMMKFYKKMQPVDCKSHHTDLVYVVNGTLRFSKPISNKTHCVMLPVIRGPGDYKISYGPPIDVKLDGTPLVSEFFKIQCTEDKKIIYENIQLGIHANQTIIDRVRPSKLPANGLKLSVLMMGFDSMSRMSWYRRLPKTRDYFVNNLGAIELEGHSIMGDGTPAALFPMLTGKHEIELPEARRSKKGAKPVDDFPWIWKDFQKNGYITSWADASINIAPFNYRLLGFEHSPADFFMRPFYLALDKNLKKYKPGCHGSYRHHQIWFNYVRHMYTMYTDDPKFMFHFYAPLTHGDNNPVTMADDDLTEFIRSLKDDGYLDNTLLVLFADHGARFSAVRASLSGKLEERTPYFALRFPDWFKKAHPDIVQNVITNSKRLTTPLDVHYMLRDILRFDGSGIGSVNNRGISLFKEIPAQRTCAQADIEPHWCACMAWKELGVEDVFIKTAAQSALDTINSFTKEYRSDCALLSVKEIMHAYRSEVEESVLKFKETKGDRGLDPIMSDGTRSGHFTYQLTLVLSPSNGVFEVTLKHDNSTNAFTILPRAISRINKYGDEPSCVLQKNREIRQYCYCKNQ